MKIKETTIKLKEFISKQNKLISENQYIKKRKQKSFDEFKHSAKLIK